jgi:predicted amidohydrolase
LLRLCRAKILDTPARMLQDAAMRVTSIQLEIGRRSKAERLDYALSQLERARGSDLILLPEMWPCGYFAFARYASESEPLNGPLLKGLSEKARALKAHLLIGSFVERDGDKLYNTSVLLASHGEMLARYRKIHLFGFGSQESRLLRPGSEVAVAATPWGKVGLSICYDLRFPELYRRMLDRGAEIFLVASAWPRPRLESWRLFNRARANENLAYLFSCNCAGSQEAAAVAQSGETAREVVHYGGHSMFVNPFGEVLAEAGDGEEMISADVDQERVRLARKEFPALDDRVFR